MGFDIFLGLVGLFTVIISSMSAHGAQQNAMDKQVQLTQDVNNQNLAFTKAENEINRQREDTAIQRSRKDAEAAGFSPLAGISGASSTYASLPQSVVPDISGFASNLFGLSSSSSSMISNVLSNVGNKFAEMPMRSLQLEGLRFENVKRSADASSSLFEALYAADTLSDRVKSTKAKAALDDYITDRVKDLNLLPSAYSSGVPNIVKQGFDGIKRVGSKLTENLDEVMEIVDKAKKGKKLDEDEKKRLNIYNNYLELQRNLF